MPDELDIEIAADGSVRVATHGVKGKACLEYVKVFQEMLGEVHDRALTPEYYEETVSTSARIEQRQLRG